MQKLMWPAEVSPTPCWSPLIMLDACDSFPLHLTAPFLSLQAPSSPGGESIPQCCVHLPGSTDLELQLP